MYLGSISSQIKMQKVCKNSQEQINVVRANLFRLTIKNIENCLD